MMRYWLVKSEPSSWSWNDQVKVGTKGTAWTGVRNHTAKKNLQAMTKGDRCFFYHSGEGKEIVGIVEVTREAYPDPTDKSGAFCAVDMRAANALNHPVSLVAIKDEPKLHAMMLLKQSRLSVQPVTAQEWQLIEKMGK